MNISNFSTNELKTIIYGLASLFSEHAVGKHLDTKFLNDIEHAKLMDLFRLELRKREEFGKEKEDLK